LPRVFKGNGFWENGTSRTDSGKSWRAGGVAFITPGMTAPFFRVVSAGALAGCLALGIGCKKEPNAPPPAPPGPPPAQQTSAPPPPPPPPAPVPAPAVPPAPAISPATSAPTVQVEAKPSAADEAKAQAIIDAARKLVAENKWQEVAPALLQLQGTKLTPAQEQSLLELKDQLEKMLREALGK
jgi:hypothetical protein